MTEAKAKMERLFPASPMPYISPTIPSAPRIGVLNTSYSATEITMPALIGPSNPDDFYKACEELKLSTNNIVDHYLSTLSLEVQKSDGTIDESAKLKEGDVKSEFPFKTVYEAPFQHGNRGAKLRWTVTSNGPNSYHMSSFPGIMKDQAGHTYIQMEKGREIPKEQLEEEEKKKEGSRFRPIADIKEKSKKKKKNRNRK
jgi:hypothetical protein